MIQDLSLSRLRQIMKSHFKQKSATKLYQELSVLHQEASESPEDFLVRALNLKQQIIFVSNGGVRKLLGHLDTTVGKSRILLRLPTHSSSYYK